MNKTIKAAVIGDPIAHSLSPKIHNFFLQKYKISGSYQLINVKPKDLNHDVARIIKEVYKGFNVTIPHKENILPLCHHLSKTAKIIGAVNTVLILEDGKIFGHNSDAQGFINNLKYSVPSFIAKNKNAFVIGAGGASRAVIYALINERIKNIAITNRSEIKAQKLIKDFSNFAKTKNCQLHLLSKEDFQDQLKNCDILVNSTSLGMQGCDKLEINIKNLAKSAIVYDIVYRPLITNMLQQAKYQGNEIVTGIGMLIFQAMVGFEMWYGKKAEYCQELAELLIENQ